MLKGSMALQKHIPPSNARRLNMKPLSFSVKMHEKARLADSEMSPTTEADVDVDLREVYFLMMHFLSAGPCQRTCGQFWNELLEHDLLPRRYHAWYSRSGAPSGDENDDGLSFPLSYNKLVERYPYIAKDHLVKLLKQLMLNKAHPLQGMVGGNAPNAADVPTLLGQGPFSLLSHDENKANNEVRPPPIHMRWPHMHADQVRGLGLREIGGGFARHQRPASTRAACYAIAKPSTMVQKMQDIKKIRGHRNAVYCAIFDRSGRFVITGSDDRLVKVWSMETAYCLASCRGHEGDITDLAVSSNNFCVASSSNDCIIRVWHLPDGLPISVLRGHTGAVTAIAFNPRPSAQYQLLSSADDGTCRLWDARNSSSKPRIYVPRPADAGRSSILSSSNGRQNNQIFCCAFNASGTVFVTGSSDALARVWNACKPAVDDPDQPIHEMDILSGHENDVNYVQFSGCAVASRFSTADINKEENTVKFKSSWFAHDNIVTCSRDGSAIIWIPRSRKSHGKAGRWTRAYHLKVPPPPVPPQPPRGGPRQRVPPTPRGVNMIVWSLDNRFVLAAIMDCRICVWNAADGSLVHSLTGHTESTYVLDVHPFNPRIAMSAGYDGKTIIWDIWEGKPIRTYETGRFRLVDGKFSPDGTSIILSDDVGQLYILSTGQGESKKDAKYDQFFLGDYRPLIQDTHGNVLDQETQLAPYRRNMQDLLCDSSMIPYPEPYQSMYQKRRFGILGIEWRPSSVRFAVGPDLNSDQDFQIFPLADLDVLIDPLLEFVDAMDVEPEIEVLSDDTDSEYHGTEECSFGGNEVSFSSSTSDDLGCSGEDSGTEDADGVRRSKRKKKKTYIDMTTSSGRRVKRRNLDECDGISHRDKQTRKSKIRRKTSRKKSSSKSSRPRRAAARNALTLFSKIKRQSPGREDVYGSEIDSSESESVLENSGFESEESDTSSLDEQIKRSKGKEIVSDDNENAHRPQDVHGSHEITSGRKRLVLKFPIRNSNKVSVPDHSVAKTQNNSDFAGSSSKAFDEAVEVHGSSLGQQNTRHLTNEQESILDLCEARMDGQIRWGGVRARTSKRMRLTETMPSATPDFITLNNGHGGGDDNCRGPNLEAECGARIGSSRDELDEATHMIEERAAAGDLDTLDYDSVKGIPSSNRFSSSNGLPHREASPDGVSCSANSKHLINGSTETSQNAASILTTLRIKSGRSTANNNGTHEKNGKCKPYSINPSVLDQKCSSDVERNGLQELEGHNANASSVSLESKDSHSRNSDRMFRAVYRRSKSVKGRTSLQGDGHVMGEGTSNVSSHNLDTDTGTKSDVADETQRTVSKGITVTPQESDLVNTRSIDGSRRTHNSSRHRSDPFSHEEWRSGMTVGLRSSRNRRVNYVRDISLLDRRKPYQSQKKVSWLMLSMPDGSRYIPQLGDEVAYLRQGHEEYVSSCRSSERGPWEYLKGEIRAVEFCNVVGLDYSTVPGSGDSCCKMTLEFLDPSSSVYGKTFKLTLPEVTSFPDFLVERTRYEAAMERNWTARDKCQVWWKNEGEECGSWWEGRIIAVKAKSPEFPDSPWERHQIQYKSDPGELHLHSPWELHDAETQWEQPHLDDLIKEKLLSAFSKLEKSGDRPQDTYGVQKLKQVSQKTNFFNRFPVPFSLDVIQSRLENNYYRNLEALKHDIQVMLSNAESYFGKNAELSAKMKRLSDCFNRTLSSL